MPHLTSINHGRGNAESNYRDSTTQGFHSYVNHCTIPNSQPSLRGPSCFRACGRLQPSSRSLSHRSSLRIPPHHRPAPPPPKHPPPPPTTTLHRHEPGSTTAAAAPPPAAAAAERHGDD